MKNKEKILLTSIAIAIAVMLIFTFTFFNGNAANKGTGYVSYDKEDSARFREIATGTTGNGDVSIGLTPKSFNNGQLVVDVAVNTHSVDLSEFDLKQITTLEYNGKTATPLSAPVLRGHHAYGELIFDLKSEGLADFKIIIEGIPKISRRVFKWNEK